MVEVNWKSWGMIAVLGLFLFLQLLRHLPGNGRINTWDAEGVLPRTDVPYSVTSDKDPSPQRPRLKIDHISLNGALGMDQLQKFQAANAAAAAKTDAAAQAAAKPDDKAKKKDEVCDETTPKIDPKTGLLVPCKKKKKSTKPTVTAPSAPQSPTTDSSSNTDSTDNGGGSNLGGGIGGQMKNVAVQKPNDFDDSLQAWQNRLLGSPSLSETKLFLEHYQRGTVTADVFYQIVEQMLADSRDEMKELGVMCAGVTPSVISFQLLAGVQTTEPTTSPVRTAADSYLNNYSDITYLGILQRVLSNPNADNSTVNAAQRVDTAAQRYLRIVTATGANLKAYARAAIYFKPFVTLLTALEKSTNSTVAYQSKRSLSDVQSLLNSLSGTGTTMGTTPTATAANGSDATGGGAPVAAFSAL